MIIDLLKLYTFDQMYANSPHMIIELLNLRTCDQINNINLVWIDIIHVISNLIQKGVNCMASCNKMIDNGVNYLFWLDV